MRSVIFLLKLGSIMHYCLADETVRVLERNFLTVIGSTRYFTSPI